MLALDALSEHRLTYRCGKDLSCNYRPIIEKYI